MQVHVGIGAHIRQRVPLHTGSSWLPMAGGHPIPVYRVSVGEGDDRTPEASQQWLQWQRPGDDPSAQVAGRSAYSGIMAIAPLDHHRIVIGLSDKETSTYGQDALHEIRLEDRQLRSIAQSELTDKKHEDAAFELRKQEIELRKAELHQQRELEKARLELEIEKMKQAEDLASQKRKDREKESKKYKGRPKLPYFDEEHDSIDSYLFRFEKHATNMDWDRADWAGVLSLLLKGKASTYYHELLTSNVQEYILAAHLLKRFQCTEEGFHTKFCSARPEMCENMPTFFARLSRVFSRWIDHAGVGHSFKKLVDLCLRQQILASCAAPLVTFLNRGND